MFIYLFHYFRLTPNNLLRKHRWETLA